MKFESAFNIGDLCWCTNGEGYVRALNIGQIRIEMTDSPGIIDNLFDNFKAQKSYIETYMCVETGIGSGNVYTLGRNIFKTEDEALKAVKKEA